MIKYMIRKCWADGSSTYGFKYPMEVGAVVECPDWGPAITCGNGLHGLEDGNGDWHLLKGQVWQVISYLEKDRVKIDNMKVKIKCGVIEYVGNKQGLIDFVNQGKLKPINESAYYWAMNIGDRSIMMNKVIDSKWAYYWAMNIGNKDIMIDRIKSSEWAYEWALLFGDNDVMKPRIKSSEFAYRWAICIGDRETMIHLIKDEQWAYEWAATLGNRRIMRDRIKTVYFATKWAATLGDKKFMKNKFPSIKKDLI